MALDKVKIALQYALPKHGLSRLTGKLAAAEMGPITQGCIKAFIRAYDINMSEAEFEEPSAYATFNDFFTRALKPGSRPLHDGDDVLVYPVDGTISQLGPINNGELIQAKGHSYSTLELLGGNAEHAELFHDGAFSTIYLAPSDYHRIHMPCKATLTDMIYVPGDLFSVNPLTAENVPNLFARNERVVCLFDTEFGPMGMVLVGATIVASIETTWSGTVTPPAGKDVFHWQYPKTGNQAITFEKGDEMGRFKLGSTVIMLFPAGATEFSANTGIGTITRLGGKYATSKST